MTSRENSLLQEAAKSRGNSTMCVKEKEIIFALPPCFPVVNHSSISKLLLSGPLSWKGRMAQREVSKAGQSEAPMSRESKVAWALRACGR